MAVAIMAMKTTESFASNTFGIGAGNHESAMPTLPIPARTPATGVRNPNKSETPLATANKPTTLVPNAGLLEATRLTAP